jgi:hypothetical protein
LWWFVQPEGFEQKVAFVRLAGTVAGGAAVAGGLLVNFWGQWINQKTQDENQKHQPTVARSGGWQGPLGADVSELVKKGDDDG